MRNNRILPDINSEVKHFSTQFITDNYLLDGEYVKTEYQYQLNIGQIYSRWFDYKESGNYIIKNGSINGDSKVMNVNNSFHDFYFAKNTVDNTGNISTTTYYIVGEYLDNLEARVTGFETLTTIITDIEQAGFLEHINNNDIHFSKSLLDDLEDRVEVNENNIYNINISIIDFENRITSNTSQITINKNNIASNLSQITINKNNITTNRTDIDINTGNIDANRTDIDANRTDIDANRTDIDANRTDIDDLLNDIIYTNEVILIDGTIESLTPSDTLQSQANEGFKSQIEINTSDIANIEDDLIVIDDRLDDLEAIDLETENVNVTYPILERPDGTNTITNQSELNQLFKTEIESKIDSSLIGQPNGVAPLDSEGIVPANHLPAFAQEIIEVYETTSGTAYASDWFTEKGIISYETNGGTIYTSDWLTDVSGSSTPLTPVDGEFYYNSDDGLSYQWDESTTTYIASADIPLIPSSEIIYVVIETGITATINETYRWSGTAYVLISQAITLGTSHTTAYYGDLGQIAYEHSQITDGSNPHNNETEDIPLTNLTTEVIDGGVATNQSEANEEFVTAIESLKNDTKYTTLIYTLNVVLTQTTPTSGDCNIIDNTTYYSVEVSKYNSEGIPNELLVNLGDLSRVQLSNKFDTDYIYGTVENFVEYTTYVSFDLVDISGTLVDGKEIFIEFSNVGSYLTEAEATELTDGSSTTLHTHSYNNLDDQLVGGTNITITDGVVDCDIELGDLSAVNFRSSTVKNVDVSSTFTDINLTPTITTTKIFGDKLKYDSNTGTLLLNENSVDESEDFIIKVTLQYSFDIASYAIYDNDVSIDTYTDEFRVILQESSSVLRSLNTFKINGFVIDEDESDLTDDMYKTISGAALVELSYTNSTDFYRFIGIQARSGYGNSYLSVRNQSLSIIELGNVTGALSGGSGSGGYTEDILLTDAVLESISGESSTQSDVNKEFINGIVGTDYKNKNTFNYHYKETISELPTSGYTTINMITAEDIVMSQYDTGIIPASNSSFLVKFYDYYYMSQGSDLYISTDEGETWSWLYDIGSNILCMNDVWAPNLGTGILILGCVDGYHYAAPADGSGSAPSGAFDYENIYDVTTNTNINFIHEVSFSNDNLILMISDYNKILSSTNAEIFTEVADYSSTGVTFNCITDFADSGSIVFGTDQGVYVSTNWDSTDPADGSGAWSAWTPSKTDVYETSGGTYLTSDWLTDTEGSSTPITPSEGVTYYINESGSSYYEQAYIWDATSSTYVLSTYNTDITGFIKCLDTDTNVDFMVCGEGLYSDTSGWRWGGGWTRINTTKNLTSVLRSGNETITFGSTDGNLYFTDFDGTLIQSQAAGISNNLFITGNKLLSATTTGLYYGDSERYNLYINYLTNDGINISGLATLGLNVIAKNENGIPYCILKNLKNITRVDSNMYAIASFKSITCLNTPSEEDFINFESVSIDINTSNIKLSSFSERLDESSATYFSDSYKDLISQFQIVRSFAYNVHYTSSIYIMNEMVGETSYIAGSGVEFESTWLSTTSGGSSLTPIDGTTYYIADTSSEYYGNYYTWNNSSALYIQEYIPVEWNPLTEEGDIGTFNIAWNETYQIYNVILNKFNQYSVKVNIFDTIINNSSILIQQKTSGYFISGLIDNLTDNGHYVTFDIYNTNGSYDIDTQEIEGVRDGEQIYIEFINANNSEVIKFLVYNNTALDLDPLTPIQVNGVHDIGTISYPTIRESSAVPQDPNLSTNVAVTLENILPGQLGYVARSGIYRNIDTSALTENVVYYLGTSNNITTSEPDYPNYSVKLFKCLSTSINNGIIDIDVDAGGSYKEGTTSTSSYLNTFPIASASNSITIKSGTSSLWSCSATMCKPYDIVNIDVGVSTLKVYNTQSSGDAILAIYKLDSGSNTDLTLVANTDILSIGANGAGWYESTITNINESFSSNDVLYFVLFSSANDIHIAGISSSIANTSPYVTGTLDNNDVGDIGTNGAPTSLTLSTSLSYNMYVELLK